MFIMLVNPIRTPLFPYTTLFRSQASAFPLRGNSPPDRDCFDRQIKTAKYPRRQVNTATCIITEANPILSENGGGPDRKSTRLNSSHMSISYAVFCLKKKKDTQLN